MSPGCTGARLSCVNASWASLESDSASRASAWLARRLMRLKRSSPRPWLSCTRPMSASVLQAAPNSMLPSGLIATCWHVARVEPHSLAGLWKASSLMAVWLLQQDMHFAAKQTMSTALQNMLF